MQYGSDDWKRGSVVVKRERRGMFKQSYALESASQAAQWSHTLSCFCYLIYLFKKKKKTCPKKKKRKEKSIGEFKTGERFNSQNAHTQTRRQGLGQRSNGPELSPFRLRTSEVPLCAALHLFYPSSLIRPGWPHDPGARVTCQSTVYSWAWGLTLRQHLSCEEGGRKKRGLCFSVEKTKANIRNQPLLWFWNKWIKIYHPLVSALVSSDFRECSAPTLCTDDMHVW